MNNALRPVASVDDLLRLAPLDRFSAAASRAAFSTVPRRRGGAPGTRRSAGTLFAVVSEKRTGRPQLSHFLPRGREARWIVGCRLVVSARTGMPLLTISAAGTAHSATKPAGGSDPASSKRSGSIDRLPFPELETALCAIAWGAQNRSRRSARPTGCAGAKPARLGTSGWTSGCCG